MFLSRKLVMRSSCLVLLGAIVACSSTEPAQSPDPASAADTVVAASEETRSALGVVEWRIGQGDGTKSLAAVGVGQDGSTVTDVGLWLESRGQNAGVITYDVKAPEALTLRFEIQSGGASAANLEDIAKAPRARAIIAQMGKDLQHADVQTPKSITQSVHPLLGPRSAFGQRLVNSFSQCLVDSGGNGCKGQLLGTLAGVASTGVCLVSDGVTLGALTAACASSGIAAIGSWVSMNESGCAFRPCQSGPKS
jgi:hypothetical protein